MTRITQQELFREAKIISQPFAVADGLGVDSTAHLIILRNLGIIPQVIQFSDTGAEKPETYDYIPKRRDWLKRNGFPDLTIVRYVPKNFKNWPPYYTLEDNCLTNATVPGISVGPANCSIKWKQAPMHTFMKAWDPAIQAWRQGLPVIKAIGYDAGTRDRQRTYAAPEDKTGQYIFVKPLQDAGLDREACIELIKREGEEVPVKSSCFFCLAMKPHEVDALPQEYLRRIVRIEARAIPRLHTSEGLWRKTVKGTRGATPKPGSMAKYIAQKRLLDPDEVEQIMTTTPQEIVSYQQGYADALSNGAVADFIERSKPKDYRHYDPSKPIPTCPA
jgi:hypothetical protein